MRRVRLDDVSCQNSLSLHEMCNVRASADIAGGDGSGTTAAAERVERVEQMLCL